METDNTRQVKILALIFGIIVVVLIGISILDALNGRPNVSEVAISSSINAVAPLGTDSFVYSNGSTLAVHNYTTGQSQTIAPSNAGLNAIDSVTASPNGNYVLFHDRTFSTNGVLGTTLGNRDPGLDWWWLYNVKTQTFQTLPQGLLLAKLSNTNVYVLTYSGGSEQITTYNNSNLQQTNQITVTGSSDFDPANGGFLLETPNNDLYYTQNGVVNNQLLQNFSLTGVTSDGATAIGVLTQNGSRNLVTVNVQSGQVTTIASGVIDEPSWSSTGSVLYVNSSNKLATYNVMTGETDVWVLGGALKNVNTENLKLVAMAGPSAAILGTSSSNSYYLVGKNVSFVQNF